MGKTDMYSSEHMKKFERAPTATFWRCKACGDIARVDKFAGVEAWYCGTCHPELLAAHEPDPVVETGTHKTPPPNAPVRPPDWVDVDAQYRDVEIPPTDGQYDRQTKRRLHITMRCLLCAQMRMTVFDIPERIKGFRQIDANSLLGHLEREYAYTDWPTVHNDEDCYKATRARFNVRHVDPGEIIEP